MKQELRGHINIKEQSTLPIRLVYTSVCRALHRIRGGHEFNSRKSIFFQAPFLISIRCN